MKKFVLISLSILAFSLAQAQNPINWTYSAKKIADKTYEIHLTAAIQPGWHLYSQTQPSDAVAEPTSFTFVGNPLLALDGKVKELGKVEKFHDANLDVSANQFSTTVDFVQVVKLKANAKTNLTGKLSYQTCNDERCLPLKSVNFAVAIK